MTFDLHLDMTEIGGGVSPSIPENSLDSHTCAVLVDAVQICLSALGVPPAAGIERLVRTVRAVDVVVAVKGGEGHAVISSDGYLKAVTW